jgi:subtilisin family serine protease
MKHRITGPLRFLAVVLAAGAALTVSACGGGGGGGGGRPTPTPGVTPLVGCNNGAHSISIAAESLTAVRRAPSRAPRPTFIPDRILVKFTSNGTEPEVAQAMTRMRAAQVASRNQAGYVVWTIAPAKDPRTAASSLIGTRGIADAQPIVARYMQVPNDPNLGAAPPYVGPLVNPPTQWDLYYIQMPNAWAITQGVPTVTIAIIDSGYDANNVDICEKVVGSAVFDTGNGTEDTNATAQDTDGHGSNVSGIAAGVTNNLTRYAGVGWMIDLLEVRVFPNQTPTNETPGASNLDVAGAINWAVGKGADVISMSLGATGICDKPEADAIAAAFTAGRIVVVAAGNEGASSIDSPANCPDTIAVGASAIDDYSSPAFMASPQEYVASYSNFGTGLTLVAPGGDPQPSQVTCNVGTTCDYLQWITQSYSSTACTCPPSGSFPGNQPGLSVFIAGTSQATPHVAGVAALIYSKKMGTPLNTIRDTIRTILNNQSLGSDDICGNCAQEGAGRLNAQKALTNA